MAGYVQRHMSVSTGPPAASGGQLRLYAQRGLVEALFVHHGGLVQQVLGHLPLVLDFVGSLLKLANLPDDVRYL